MKDLLDGVRGLLILAAMLAGASTVFWSPILAVILAGIGAGAVLVLATGGRLRS